MDNSEPSAEAAGPPVTGTHGRNRPAIPVPADFVPLRLVLQPSGASVELTRADMLIGRHSQADIRLPLPDVSRRHCRFFFGEGVWQVLDLNSLNGVFLNGEPIRQATVRQGDLLRIGGFTFAVDLGGAEPQAAEDDASEGLIRSIFKTLPSPACEAEPRRRAS
jgi:pSer/pThr/pTyr-binding forkhead associated (FHA) protein